MQTCSDTCRVGGGVAERGALRSVDGLDADVVVHSLPYVEGIARVVREDRRDHTGATDREDGGACAALDGQQIGGLYGVALDLELAFV